MDLSAIQTSPPWGTDPADDPALKDLAAKPFVLSRPERQSVPFVFASPHSGRIYPRSFAEAARLDAASLRKSEDAFVDDLFDFVPELGAPFLAARFPRVFVDANRAADEIDPAMFDGPLAEPAGPRTPRLAAGLGVIPRIVRDGMEIYARPLPVEEAAFRLECFHRPYHKALRQLVDETRARFGAAILIDCHSMPPPAKSCDIVLGDCHGEAASAELMAMAQKHLAALGFTVLRNSPYAGGYTTKLHGRPRSAVHAFQIEISRTLYLDEIEMQPKADFESRRHQFRMFTTRLIADACEWLARRGYIAPIPEF